MSARISIGGITLTIPEGATIGLELSNGSEGPTVNLSGRPPKQKALTGPVRVPLLALEAPAMTIKENTPSSEVRTRILKELGEISEPITTVALVRKILGGGSPAKHRAGLARLLHQMQEEGEIRRARRSSTQKHHRWSLKT